MNLKQVLMIIFLILLFSEKIFIFIYNPSHILDNLSISKLLYQTLFSFTYFTLLIRKFELATKKFKLSSSALSLNLSNLIIIN